MDQLFMAATGWLPWCTPEIALHTPIGELELALDGKVDFLKKTDPWRSQKDIEEEKLLNQPPNPEAAMNAFIALARRAREKQEAVAKAKGSPDG